MPPDGGDSLNAAPCVAPGSSTETGATGRRPLGIAVLAMAMVAMAYDVFLPGQPVPNDLPGRSALAYAAALSMAAAALGLQWRRFAGSAALVLSIYFGVLVALLMNGRIVASHPTVFGVYSGTAEQLAIAAGATIVSARHAAWTDANRRRVVSAARIVFGACVVLFGIAHFVYMNLTAPLVPAWLPPSQVFWGYATGVAQIVAGLAIMATICARSAATLLAVLYACFQVLVHAPTLIAGPRSLEQWSENALNLALVAVACVVSASFRQEPRCGRRPGR